MSDLETNGQKTTRLWSKMESIFPGWIYIVSSHEGQERKNKLEKEHQYYRGELENCRK